jgi:LysM repeat protein
MRKISFWLLVLTLATRGVQAQDAATQQQIDKLSGQLQDIIDAEAAQGKRLEALEHDVADLREKANAPAAPDNSASTDDLKKLAVQVREIDQKRQDDRELILKKIEDLGKISAAPVHAHKAPSAPKDTAEVTASTDTTPQKGYEYQVKAGDYLSAIVKAYREQGVKVTVPQVLKANPGLSANTLYAGKTIFIPDPNAKQ